MFIVTSSTREGMEMGMQAQLNRVLHGCTARNKKLLFQVEIHSAQIPPVQAVMGVGLLSKH